MAKVRLSETLLRQFMTNGYAMPKSVAEVFGIDTTRKGWIAESVGKVVEVDMHKAKLALAHINKRTERANRKQARRLTQPVNVD
jgi:hypothetical protein